MTKQTEEDEEGALCIQAACCMQLCGQVVGDDILQHVMPLVHANIQHQNWHLREAATYSFGAIMDGWYVLFEGGEKEKKLFSAFLVEFIVVFELFDFLLKIDNL